MKAEPGVWAGGIAALLACGAGWHWIVVAVVAVVAGLFVDWVDASMYSNAACRRCQGSPRIYNITRTRWRDCRRCGGRGRRRPLLAGRSS